ncbi:hypothetical protein QOT17_001005 [Balamuthia mandrillaris]
MALTLTTAFYALTGLSASLLTNATIHRPLWRNMPRHILFGGLGYWLGVWTEEYRDKQALGLKQAQEYTQQKFYKSFRPAPFAERIVAERTPHVPADLQLDAEQILRD